MCSVQAGLDCMPRAKGDGSPFFSSHLVADRQDRNYSRRFSHRVRSHLGDGGAWCLQVYRRLCARKQANGRSAGIGPTLVAT